MSANRCSTAESSDQGRRDKQAHPEHTQTNQTQIKRHTLPKVTARPLPKVTGQALNHGRNGCVAMPDHGRNGGQLLDHGRNGGVVKPNVA